MDKITVESRIGGKNIHGDTLIVYQLLADKVNEIIDKLDAIGAKVDSFAPAEKTLKKK